MADSDVMMYNSDMEKKLFESLTTGEGTYAYQHQTQSKPKSSVRFHADVNDQTTERPRKKKLVRDSQIAREYVGSPGSKRHNRYLNKMELLDKALSDSESELEIEVEFRVEYKPTAFSLLFTDDDVKELWDPFVDTTEESQSEMLKNLFPAATPRRKSKLHATAPEDCFNVLNREEKRYLKRHTGNVAIEKFEEIIIDFILSRRTVITRKYTEDECLMFGLICVYYSVAVTAEEVEKGHVGVTLRKPKKGTQLPSVRLSEYLKVMQQQSA